MDRLTLAAILTPDLTILPPNASVADALQLMAKNQLSALVVVDDNNHPKGIFTEWDSLKVIAEQISTTSRLDTVMSKQVFTARTHDEMHDAYTLMSEKMIRHLVVVDDHDIVVGIVTQGDFFRHIGFDSFACIKSITDIMTKNIVTLAHDATITFAAEQMAKQHSGYAIIVDNMHPIGLITEQDILCYASSGSISTQDPISHIYQTNFPIAAEKEPLSEVAIIMEQHGVHQIIITDDAGKLIGLLTRHDLLQAIHGNYFEFLIHQIDVKSTALNELKNVYAQLVKDKEDLSKSEYKFRTLFNMLPDGVTLIDPETGLIIGFNQMAADQLGYTQEEFSHLTINDFDGIETTEETRSRIAAILENEGQQYQFETLHKHKNNTLMNVHVTVATIMIEQKKLFLAYFQNVTSKTKRDASIQEQLDLLSELASNAPINHQLEQIALFAEKQSNGVRCSILVFDEKNKTLQSAAAPSIPKAYYDAINELPVAFGNGSCGIADAIKEPVIVADVLSDPVWKKHQPLIESFSWLRSCWSTPFFSSDGCLLGRLAFYADMARNPDEHESELMTYSASLAGMVVERFQRQEAFSNQATFLHTLVDTIPDLIWLKDIAGVYLACNPMFERFFGATEKEIIGKTDYDFVSKELADFFRANDLKAMQANKPLSNEEYLTFADGSHEGLYETYKTPMKSAEGNIAGVLGVARDITERKQHEEAIRRREGELKRAQSIAHIGSWVLDTETNHLVCSDEFYRIFGIPIGTELTYERCLQAVHPDDREIVSGAWQKVKVGAFSEIEHRIIVNDHVRWIKESSEFEFDTDGNMIASIGTAQDITERKAYEAKLEYMANYDALTGLYSRNFLHSYLKKSIDKAQRNDHILAVIIFDLDRFKDVNDSFGHSAGDELLIFVATRFNDRLRNQDVVGRLGGDEFAIVIDLLARPEDAARLTEEIIASINRAFILSNGISVNISASAGIAIFPEHGVTSEELIQHADAALYRAKNEGRNTYRYYTDTLTTLAKNRITMEAKLRHAIEYGELRVYYQPQVYMATGYIVGAEALVRWQHPTEGIIPPDSFIPLAEETGLINMIGEWVLRETCRQGKIWLDRGYRLILAVNLSPHQLRHQNIPALVERVLKETHYPANRLELEITESALMQREEESVTILHALRAMGIRLAIDDFGTGYSSLSYLKRFSLDVLKIDKSFIDEIPFNKDDVAITKAIISMAKALNFSVLAEGTERVEQIEFLREHGCDLYQGYYKSKPVPADLFEVLLTQPEN